MEDNLKNRTLQLLAVPRLMGKHFFIPEYQRGYRWEKQQVYQLLSDLWKYFKEGTKNPDGFYCLQPVVVKVCSEETIKKFRLENLEGIEPYDRDDPGHLGPRNDVWYEVIDGQQRLTTLRILLAIYFQEFNRFVKADFYELRYATRPEFKEIFDMIEVNAREQIATINEKFTYRNVDVEYVRQCLNSIFEWFKDDNILEKNKFNEIGNFLKNVYNDATKDVNIQIVWYETIEKNDSRDIFERLNNLKVPLSSSELIRALFLSDNAEYNYELNPIQKTLSSEHQKTIIEEEKRRKQNNINAKWDEIEHFFHDDKLWGFITNRDAAQYRNRIEILFDFMSEKYARKDSTSENDRLFTYLWFDQRKEDLWSLWNDVIKYFDTIRYWYENRNYYHKIGYLIHEKQDEIVISLLKFANKDEHRKSEFEAKLKEEIKKTIGESKKFSDLHYDDKNDYRILKSLLLLYNVEYTRQLGNGDFFRFDQYKDVEKESKWTLEHIHAQNSDCLDATKRTEWRDWATFTIEAREALPLHSEKIEDLLTDLKKLKSNLNDDLANNTAKIRFEDVTRLFERDLNLWSDGKPNIVMHQLSNLALLSGDINSGIGKGAFSLKQQYINKCIADGRYMPVCTQRVFLKHYYKEKDIPNNQGKSSPKELLYQQGYVWNDLDRSAYLENIKKILLPYFNNDNF
ncbi:MAG: DUF262 domain-containing protein [Muribaculaceae bacterium]|nr:DUF262 domain-containing protein [Muribaculaceae bacterium]